VEYILRRAKHLGLEFSEEFDSLCELQDLLFEAEDQRARLEQAGEDAFRQDAIIEKLREQIKSDKKKLP